MIYKNHLLWTAFSVAVTGSALASVPAEEAKNLGGKLTQFGAEQAGNKEGTIPPYSGKAPKAPAGYDEKDPGQRPDPYNDKPVFAITAQNADKYADKLDKMVELFKRFPGYRMNVYPTHRDFAYPKYVLENSVRNATSCKATQNELKLEGCFGGFPFPIPKTGNQVMWNHLLAFQSASLYGITESWVTSANGEPVMTTRNDSLQQFAYYQPGNTKPNASNIAYWKNLSTDLGPARKVGGKLVLIDSLDMVDVGRRVYQYIPGQRRVKLAPNLAYDTPSPNSGGASTMDDAKLFLGALDRYDFKLIGKKEKFIPYNNFSLTNSKGCSIEKVVKSTSFPNPDCVRWELHRVWVVEANLKAGFRHVYPKRVFYFDEDAPGAGVGEAYDAGGKLYRILSQIAFPFYESELGGSTDGSFATDLQTGVWAVQGLPMISGLGGGWHSVPHVEDRIYSPEAMAGQGIR